MKYLCNWDDVPELKVLDAEINAARKIVDQKITFLKKQADTIAEEYKKTSKEAWAKVYQPLKDKGYLPKDYVDERGDLTLKQDGQLMIKDYDDKDGNDPLKSLLKALINKNAGSIEIKL